MNLADVDARIITAVCLWVIGFIVTGFTLKVWWTAPVNRAFLFGPYLTPQGLRLVLTGWPLLFLLGALALAGGTSRLAYWLQDRGAPNIESLAALSSLVEAALALWAAGALVIFCIRTWITWRRG